MQQSCCLTSLSEVTARKSDASALAKQASRVQKYVLPGPDSDVSRVIGRNVDHHVIAQDPSESALSPMFAGVLLGSTHTFLPAAVPDPFVNALADAPLVKAASSPCRLLAETAGSAPEVLEKLQRTGSNRGHRMQPGATHMDQPPCLPRKKCPQPLHDREVWHCFSLHVAHHSGENEVARLLAGVGKNQIGPTVPKRKLAESLVHPDNFPGFQRPCREQV